MTWRLVDLTQVCIPWKPTQDAGVALPNQVSLLWDPQPRIPSAFYCTFPDPPSAEAQAGVWASESPETNWDPKD